MTNRSPEAIEAYREYFSHLPEKNTVFSKVLNVLGVVAGNQEGIGEVMQAYALQEREHLDEVMRAGRNLASGHYGEHDLDVLGDADRVVRTVAHFLERIPPAMKRNHAETIGKREKFSADDIEDLAHLFYSSPETRIFFQAERLVPSPQAYGSSLLRK